MRFRWPVTEHELLHPRRSDDIHARYGIAVGWRWETHASPTVWVEVHDRRIGLAQPIASLGLVEPCAVWDAMTVLRSFNFFGESMGLLQAVELLGEADLGSVVEHLEPIETALLVLRTLATDMRAIEARGV